MLPRTYVRTERVTSFARRVPNSARASSKTGNCVALLRRKVWVRVPGGPLRSTTLRRDGRDGQTPSRGLVRGSGRRGAAALLERLALVEQPHAAKRGRPARGRTAPARTGPDPGRA